MTDRYHSDGNRVFCESKHFAIAVTDQAARFAVKALNMADQLGSITNERTGEITFHRASPAEALIIPDAWSITPLHDYPLHGDDCQCVDCCPMPDAIDEATGCPASFRTESDERICTRAGCGIRWGAHEDRPPCQMSRD